MLLIGASDAMQMAHYKLTIIIIIMRCLVLRNGICLKNNLHLTDKFFDGIYKKSVELGNVDFTISCRKRLRSSSSLLFVPAGRLKCVGDRSFTVAGPRIWNQLPPQVTSAATIEGFRKSLKMHLYGGLEVL